MLKLLASFVLLDTGLSIFKSANEFFTNVDLFLLLCFLNFILGVKTAGLHTLSTKFESLIEKDSYY